MRYLRFPDGKAKALTFSYDDGVEQDLRLVEMFDRLGLKGTFNINSGLFAKEGTVYSEQTVHRRMTYNQVLNAYTGHEVAVHSYTHPFLDRVPEAVATYQVIEDRKNLEQMFKRHIRGMAYPMGTFNDNVIEILKHCGIVYSRTVTESNDFGIPEDWFRWNPTCRHKNKELMSYAERFIGNHTGRAPWLFYVWGHTYEFEKDNNWECIETFCEKVAQKDDVWYATNIEIYDYIEAYRKLRVSVDGSIIYNPGHIDVWFLDDNEMYCVECGKTIYL